MSLFESLSSDQLEELKLLLQKEITAAVVNVLKQIKSTPGSEKKSLKEIVTSQTQTEDETSDGEKASDTKFISRKISPVKETRAPLKTTKSTGPLVLIKNYTDKTHILTGKGTIGIKEKLKEFGFRYGNYPSPVGPGWMLPSIKYDLLKKFFDDNGVSFSEKDFCPEGSKNKEITSAMKIAQKNKSTETAPTEEVKKTIKEAPERKSKEPVTPNNTPVTPRESPASKAPSKKAEPAKKTSIAKNKWGNYEEKNTGLIFLKIDGIAKVVGYQDTESEETGIESVLPLDDDLIGQCIAKNWPYDSSVITEEDANNEDEKNDVEEEDS